VRALERVVVLHGYRAGPGSHWFGWLARELASDGVSTTIPRLPDSADPRPEPWIATAREAIGRPDEGLVVVGHSLGVVTALHALDAFRGGWSLGGLVAVAGFVDPLTNLPGLDPFIARRPDLARTRARTRRRASILSDDDEIVAPELSADLARLLGGAEILLPGGGHFLSIQGCTELPVLRDWIGASALRDGIGDEPAG